MGEIPIPAELDGGLFRRLGSDSESRMQPSLHVCLVAFEGISETHAEEMGISPNSTPQRRTRGVVTHNQSKTASIDNDKINLESRLFDIHDDLYSNVLQIETEMKFRFFFFPHAEEPHTKVSL